MSTARKPQWMKDEEAGPALQGPPLFFFKVEEAYGYFCQWYMCSFTDDEGTTFNCSEQYMMYHKAKAFDDKATMAAVMKEKNPRKQKGLGKQVKGFTDKAWDEVKSDVVVRGNMLKFSQCVARPGDEFVYPGGGKLEGQEPVPLRRLLLATGELELCEASHFDRVWGIGFSAEQAMKQPKSSWGENRLGKALMEVRARLREG